MKSDGRVYAMKGGGRKLFSDYQWNTGIPQRVGWVECGKMDAIAEVETEEVEIEPVEIPKGETEKVEIETVKIPKDEVVKEAPKVADKAEGKEKSVEEIREYLNGLAEQGKIKKPHHMAGEKKLRGIYNEVTK